MKLAVRSTGAHPWRRAHNLVTVALTVFAATALAERYERGSVLLTSNLPFSKWEGIFKDPMTTAAAIDRLVHHSIIIELNIPSFRLEQAKSNVQSLGSETVQPPPPAADSPEAQ